MNDLAEKALNPVDFMRNLLLSRGRDRRELGNSGDGFAGEDEWRDWHQFHGHFPFFWNGFDHGGFGNECLGDFCDLFGSLRNDCSDGDWSNDLGCSLLDAECHSDFDEHVFVAPHSRRSCLEHAEHLRLQCFGVFADSDGNEHQLAGSQITEEECYPRTA